MNSKKALSWNPVGGCFFFIFLSTLLFIYIFQINNVDKFVDRPLISQSRYSQDIYDVLVNINKARTGESLIEHSDRGWPMGASYEKYPQLDFLNYNMIRLIGKLSGSKPLPLSYTLNVFIYLTFILSGLSAFISLLYTLRWKHYTLALLGAIVFEFIPYHFLRLEWGHVHLSNYWAIPITVVFWFKLLEKPSVNSNKGSLIWLSIISALSLAFSGPYYFTFGSFGVILILMSYSMNKYSLIEKRTPFAVFFLVLLSIVCLQALQYVGQNSVNNLASPAVVRSVTQAIPLGLHFISMLLPPYYIGWNEHVREKLWGLPVTHPYLNETTSASLGLPLMIAIFFVALSIFLTIYLSKKNELNWDYKKSFLLLILTIILVCSGDSFALLLSSSTLNLIRAWNRISVFVSFAIVLYISLMVCQLNKNLRVLFMVVVFMAICFELSSYKNNRFYDLVVVENDAKFIDMLNSVTKEGDSILTLPYVPYPESSVIGVTYHHNVALFTENKLKISYGGLRGSDADKIYGIFDGISDFSKTIFLASKFGYDWILFDNRGYSIKDWNGLIKITKESCSELHQVEEFRLILRVPSCLK